MTWVVGSQFTMTSTYHKSFENVDPSYGSQSSSNKELYDMIDRRAKEILDGDICNKYKNAINKAKAKGLIEEYDARDIELRLHSKEWKQINKIIRKNEARSDTTGTSPD